MCIMCVVYVYFERGKIFDFVFSKKVTNTSPKTTGNVFCVYFYCILSVFYVYSDENTRILYFVYFHQNTQKIHSKYNKNTLSERSEVYSVVLEVAPLIPV